MTHEDFDFDEAEFRSAADRAMASIPAQRPPDWMLNGEPNPQRRESQRRRLVAYAAIAAILALTGFVVATLTDDPTGDTVTGEDAAGRPGGATAPPIAEAPTIDAQIRADREIAAEHGLEIGQIVFAEDGPAQVGQPDLVPVASDGGVAGYAKAVDILERASSYTVYGPDGASVRGVFDEETGFRPTG